MDERSSKQLYEYEGYTFFLHRESAPDSSGFQSWVVEEIRDPEGKLITPDPVEGGHMISEAEARQFAEDVIRKAIITRSEEHS